LVALLVGVSLRVAHLDYTEFEGDEARVMMRAARAMEGDEALIFEHDKGPFQLTMVMPGWRLVGMTNEWMARLPFVLANVLGLVSVFFLGRRLGHPIAGGIAVNMLAIEGYLVGLGRGLRHHNIVFVLAALGLLCLFAYYKHGRGSWIVVGSVLFAGAALAHYDAILMLPSGLLFVIGRLWRDRRRGLPGILPVLVAGLVGGVLVGLFYVPFMYNPHIGATSYYLSGRIGGKAYNNLKSTFELSAVYDSVYFLAGLALVLVGQMMVVWRGWGRGGPVMCGVLLALVGVSAFWPALWGEGRAALAWIPFVIALLGALLAPGQSIGIRALWLWLGGSATFFLFFVSLPLTHVYTIFPAWALLAGLGLERLAHWLDRRAPIALYAGAAAGVAIYVLCTGYVVMAFANYTPEYLREFPQSRSPVYWTPYEQKPVEIGLYGFPYRVGWKVIGVLFDQGRLAGSYSSNEKPRATAYYTRQAARLDCASPDMYIVAANVHDAVALRWDQIEAEYHQSIVITVDGRPTLTVYERGAIGDPVTYAAKAWDHQFDLGTTPERVAAQTATVGGDVRAGEYVSREASIGDFAYLLGYKIDDAYAVPGGYVELTLIWRARHAAPIDYQVFTHLHDGEVMRGQLDGQPVCSTHPTSQWRADQLIVDPYRVPIKDDAPPGRVPLNVGMYDLVTMDRLPVMEPDGTSIGDSVHLTDVVIREP
jgi:4-amino-4-deoxy-L-arabinose transferase-like glycosyltransferase